MLTLAPILVLYLLVTLLRRGSGGGDEVAYLHYAHAILHGSYAQTDPANPELFLWRGPGLPLILAPLVALHLPIDVARLLLGPIALFMAVVVFYRTLRLTLSPEQSIVGTYLFGLFLPLLQVLGQVYSEPLAILLVVTALYCWVRGRHQAPGTIVGCGVSLGALALVRPEYGYALMIGLVLGAGFWCLRRSLAGRSVLLASVLALLVCSPWLVYTHSQSHRLLYWSNSGSLNLYWMASPDPDDLGDPHVYARVFSDPHLASHRPFFTHLKTLPPVEQDAALRAEAVRQIEAHPVRYVRNVANNLSRLVFNFPFSFKTQSVGTYFYALPNGLLLLALLLAALLVPRKRGYWDLSAVPMGFALIGFLLHVPIAGYPRYWFPLIPVFIWFATISLAPATRPTQDLVRQLRSGVGEAATR